MKSTSTAALIVRAFLLLVLFTAFSLAQTAPPARQEDGPIDVVVQGALDSELQPLLAALENKERIQLAAWTFWKGKIGGRRVVVSRTEVGPVNAVAATTLAILHFKPRLIINQGTAGANDPELKVFDIVVGESSVDYGAFRSAHADAGAGIDQARWTPIQHRLRIDGEDRVAFKSFPGDPEAMRFALDTPYKRGRVVKGVIGTAFEFNKEIDRLVWVRKTYGASSEDMESAYAAGAAVGFKTRFLAIRIISDSEFNAPEFLEIAGEYCAAFVVDVIKRLK
ncbi:MAG: 5'-methylthioadenosine/S-adenosylhomocysteine nucleosidase [Blastocatellia bacterium]|nr:5'-methylthioadenosine/S-adenosylhomocysteine nucleosidase [Blastocatellia bacterium]